MPKRSNDFQKLILYLNKHKHPNIEILESHVLADRVTSNSREVDIYITTSLGNYKLNISIECIDKSRKADISWVEAMKAKHDKLDTNKLILVSKSGFSKQALKFASFHNIETFTYHQIEKRPPHSIFQYDSLVFKLFTQSIEKVFFVVENKEGKRITVQVDPDTTVFDETSTVIGVANDVMNFLIKKKEAIDYLWQNGLEEHKSFELHWENNKTLPIYLQQINTLTLESIEEVKISGGVDFTVRRFQPEHARIAEDSVIWGKIAVDDSNKFLFIGTPKETGAVFSLIKN